MHCCGLQDFSPPPNTYDVVWVQWVIIYLPDQDFVNFLRRMAASLREGGLVVIKDNFTMGQFIYFFIFYKDNFTMGQFIL